MKEFIKYNCHVMKINTIDKVSPEALFQSYQGKILNFEGVDCYVESCTISKCKTTIITKIKKVNE